jgi:hypothetical protein
MGDSVTIDGFLIEGNTFDIPADRTINLKAIKDLYLLNNTLICNEEVPQYTLPIAIMNCDIDMIDGVNFNIASASSTSLPLIKSITIFTFIAEILAYL